MVDIAGRVEIISGPEIIPVRVSRGHCAIARTSPPLQLPIILRPACYAVLWSLLPATEPVAVMITFWDQQTEGSIPHREVNALFAIPAVRGCSAGEQDTIPVAVGKWLFGTERLTHHSVDRTDAGDRWAQKVGGVVPPRDQKQSAEVTEAQGAAAIALLNGVEWPGDWKHAADNEHDLPED